MGTLIHCMALGKCSTSVGCYSGVTGSSPCRHQICKNVAVSCAGTCPWKGLKGKLKRLNLELRLQPDRFLNGKIGNLSVQSKVMRYHSQTRLVMVPREVDLKLLEKTLGTL